MHARMAAAALLPTSRDLFKREALFSHITFNFVFHVVLIVRKAMSDYAFTIVLISTPSGQQIVYAQPVTEPYLFFFFALLLSLRHNVASLQALLLTPATLVSRKL